MGSEEREQGQVKYIIGKLRYITLAVQIIPFVYSSLYIISLTLYLFCPEPIIKVLDTLFYVSPTIVLMLLVESKILKLCKWHRRACAIPIVPQVFVFIDYHIVELTSYERFLSIAIPIALTAILLISAYHVFIK